MKFSPAKLLSSYSIFLFLFVVFLVGFIFIGFWLNIALSNWTLLIAFLVYSCLFYVFRNKLALSSRSILYFVIFTPIIFFVGTTIFSKTYDTSYDGTFYHETGIIALANNWNPVYKPILPLPTPLPTSKLLDEGSPKAIWSVDASIYKLTRSINSATFINLYITLIALIFVYFSLRSLTVDKKMSILITLATLATPLLIDQIFSFREDSLSYSFLVIGLSSLVKIYKKDRQGIHYICLLGSLLLLAGSKFSNLYIFLSLALLGIYICYKKGLFSSKRVRYLTIGFAVFGVLVVFNPILTNTFKFHAIGFPYNQKVYADSIRLTDVPYNIRQSSKVKLFFYGIFSSSDISNAQNSNAYAKLKVPFSFTPNELLIDSNNTAKLVGGYGVLFSGVFIISIICYLYLFIRSRKLPDKKILKWVHAGVVLILISCLLIPVPNYARYNSQLFLLPIIMLIALCLVSYKNKPANKVLVWTLLIAVFLNFYVDIVPATSLQETYTKDINSQLNHLQATHKIYKVHSAVFYPSYLELSSHNIKIVVSKNNLSCKNELNLIFPTYTQLCPEN